MRTASSLAVTVRRLTRRPSDLDTTFCATTRTSPVSSLLLELISSPRSSPGRTSGRPSTPISSNSVTPHAAPARRNPPLPRQPHGRRRVPAPGHDHLVSAATRRPHRQLRVAPGQGPASLRAERRLQPLLGGVEILDQHDYPGRRLRHPLAAPLLAQARQDLLAVELQETQLVIARSMKDEMGESQVEVWLQLLDRLIRVVRHQPTPVRDLFDPAGKALHLTRIVDSRR